MRLKWLTLKRREQVVDMFEHKKRIKTWVPLQYENLKLKEKAQDLDAYFSKFERRSGKEFAFDLMKNKHNVTMDTGVQEEEEKTLESLVLTVQE